MDPSAFYQRAALDRLAAGERPEEQQAPASQRLAGVYGGQVGGGAGDPRMAAHQAMNAQAMNPTRPAAPSPWMRGASAQHMPAGVGWQGGRRPAQPGWGMAGGSLRDILSRNAAARGRPQR